METDSTSRNSSETNSRTVELSSALVDTLSAFIVKHRVQEAEFNAALEFLTQVGRHKQYGGLADALHLSRVVDDVTFADYTSGTASNIPGPFYVPDAPWLKPPYWLARPDEGGDRLVFRGTVVSAHRDAPLAGAEVEIWQANAGGWYDVQDPAIPPMNLRCRLSTDARGGFEFLTIVPGAYEIPHHGPLGDFLRMLGRDSFFRPKHIHFKVAAPGHRTLTTQIYFQGDQWLGKDSIGEAKPELVTHLMPLDEEVAKRHEVKGGFSCSFEFRLIPT